MCASRACPVALPQARSLFYEQVPCCLGRLEGRRRPQPNRIESFPFPNLPPQRVVRPPKKEYQSLGSARAPCFVLCREYQTQGVQKSTSCGSCNTGFVRNLNEAWLDGWIELDSRNYFWRLQAKFWNTHTCFRIPLFLIDNCYRGPFFFFFLATAFQFSRFPFLDRWKDREKNERQNKPHSSNEKTRVEISSGPRQDSILGG